MNKFLHHLSFRMVVAICLAGLIPLYAATIYFYLQAKDALHEAGKTRLQSVLGSRVQDMENTVNTAASDIMIASTNPVFLFQNEGKVGGVNWLEKEHDVLKALRKRLADKLDEACIIESGGAEVSRIVFDEIADSKDLSSDESGASFFHHSFEVSPGDVYQGVPYISLDSKRWVFPTVTPIANKDGKKLAVLHFEINFNYVKNVLASRADMGGGFAAVIDSDGHLLASTRGGSAGDMESREGLSDKELEALKLPKFEMATDLDDLIKRVIGGEKLSAPADVDIGGESHMVLVSPIHFLSRTQNRWFVLAALPSSEIYTSLDTWKYLAFAALATLVLGISAYLIGRGISRPLVELSRMSEAVASGELEMEIPESSRSDEIGVLQGSFRSMVGSMRDMVTGMRKRTDEVEKLNAANQGMVQSMECIVKGVKKVTQNMVSSSDTLSHAAGDMAGSNRTINEAAERLTQGMGEQSRSTAQVSLEMNLIVAAVESIATGANNQKSHVVETESSVSALAEAVQQIADSSREALAASDASRMAASNGEAAVRQTTEGMEGIRLVVFEAAQVIESLGEKSKQIGEIVGMIDEISDQTNLLALNAAIEAARAGEHGRGFAVVADEVRKLAERSAGATKEIASLVRAIQSETNTAVEAMAKGTERVEQGSALSREAAATLKNISESVQRVVEQINSVTQSAGRMTGLAGAARNATADIHRVIESNIATTSAATASTRKVLDLVNTVAAVSEESAASSGDVSVAVSRQQHAVDELAQQVNALVGLAGDLQTLVTQCELND